MLAPLPAINVEWPIMLKRVGGYRPENPAWGRSFF